MSFVADIYAKLFAKASHTHTNIVGLPNYSSGTAVTPTSTADVITWTATGNGWLSIRVYGNEIYVEYKVNNKSVASIGTAHENRSSFFIPVSKNDVVTVNRVSGSSMSAVMTFFPFK